MKKSFKNNLLVLNKIEYYAENFPNKIFIIDEKNVISFFEFYNSAIYFAKLIRAKVKKPIICIAESRTIYDYVAIFGTLYAGGTYIPINKKTPLQKVKKIIVETNSNFYVDQKKLLGKFKKEKLIDVKLLKIKKKLNFNFKIESNKIAYIIFTSGTTGKPKGVEISRENLDHYIKWIKKNIKLNRDTKFSQFPSIGFDLSVADIYLSAVSLGQLVITSNELDNLFPGNFIKKNNINHLTCTPSLISLIESSKQLNKKYLKSLKSIFFCGEPLTFLILKKIYKILPNIVIYNTYGPTEATVSITKLTLNKKNYKKYHNKFISFGKPIKNMNINFLKDDNLNSQKGEILISGPQLAAGYFKNIEETKKKFKYFGKKKYYLTGDIGFKYKNNFYFNKRKDTQVKIKGFRVELEEINNSLRSIGFQHVHTTIKKKKLISFIESSKQNELSIKKKLNHYLEKYKIPDKIIFLKKFPLSKNEKIDYKELEKFE